MLSHAALRTVVHTALSSPAEECCGLLVGPAGGPITYAIPAPNVAADRARAFAVDPAVHLATALRARREGRAVRGSFHSHVVGGAAFSAEDRAWAAWASADAVHVVVAVHAGMVREVMVHRRDNGVWRGQRVPPQEWA